MNEKTNELRGIITKFAESGCDLIDAPAKSMAVRRKMQR
jgi:hypothetical protein